MKYMARLEKLLDRCPWRRPTPRSCGAMPRRGELVTFGDGASVAIWRVAPRHSRLEARRMLGFRER
jgi:hypothetical protein